MKIANLRTEVSKFLELFTEHMKAHNVQECEDYWRRSIEEEPCWKITTEKGTFYLMLDTDQHANFHSVWVHVFTETGTKATIVGRTHHKHHACLYQDHQPKRGNESTTATELMSRAEEWLKILGLQKPQQDKPT